jgi:hypothetical protein
VLRPGSHCFGAGMILRADANMSMTLAMSVSSSRDVTGANLTSARTGFKYDDAIFFVCVCDPTEAHWTLPPPLEQGAMVTRYPVGPCHTNSPAPRSFQSV